MIEILYKKPKGRGPYEEHALVIDYLPYGRPEDPPHRRRPVAQGVGKDFFILLDLEPREGAYLDLHEEVYIGPDSEKRDKVKRVVKRIRYEDLTATAKEELPVAVEKIIESNEEDFVRFFNEARPITPRLHQLELLPGIGRKTLERILEEREKEPFSSLDDIKERVKGLRMHPKDMIKERVLAEIKGETRDKYRLFVPVGGGRRRRGGPRRGGPPRGVRRRPRP
ncbi:MAG: DUF655 domain-containing protein [Methanopyri archaeon]|nr:DUF655 domain-containing protein [Methanopyri archaeon]